MAQGMKKANRRLVRATVMIFLALALTASDSRAQDCEGPFTINMETTDPSVSGVTFDLTFPGDKLEVLGAAVNLTGLSGLFQQNVRNEGAPDNTLAVGLVAFGPRKLYRQHSGS